MSPDDRDDDADRTADVVVPVGARDPQRASPDERTAALPLPAELRGAPPPDERTAALQLPAELRSSDVDRTAPLEPGTLSAARGPQVEGRYRGLGQVELLWGCMLFATVGVVILGVLMNPDAPGTEHAAVKLPGWAQGLAIGGGVVGAVLSLLVKDLVLLVVNKSTPLVEIAGLVMAISMGLCGAGALLPFLVFNLVGAPAGALEAVAILPVMAMFVHRPSSDRLDAWSEALAAR